MKTKENCSPLHRNYIINVLMPKEQISFIYIERRIRTEIYSRWMREDRSVRNEFHVHFISGSLLLSPFGAVLSLLQVALSLLIVAVTIARRYLDNSKIKR